MIPHLGVRRGHAPRGAGHPGEGFRNQARATVYLRVRRGDAPRDNDPR